MSRRWLLHWTPNPSAQAPTNIGAIIIYALFEEYSMSFMLALPKISLHGTGAIGDMVNLLSDKRWGKALIVTDGQLVEL